MTHVHMHLAPPDARFLGTGCRLITLGSHCSVSVRASVIKLVRPLTVSDRDDDGNVLCTPEATVTHYDYDVSKHVDGKQDFCVTSMHSTTTNTKFEWMVACHASAAAFDGYVAMGFPTLQPTEAVTKLHYYTTSQSAFSGLEKDAHCIVDVLDDAECVAVCEYECFRRVLCRNFNATAAAVGLARALTTPEYNILVRAVVKDPTLCALFGRHLFEIVCKQAELIRVNGLTKVASLNGLAAKVHTGGHTSERLSVKVGTWTTRMKFANLRVCLRKADADPTARDLFCLAHLRAVEAMQTSRARAVHVAQMADVRADLARAEEHIDALEHRLHTSTDEACVICLEHKRNVAIVHAMGDDEDVRVTSNAIHTDAHLCLCESCAESYTPSTCPICRRGISAFIKVYNTATEVRLHTSEVRL